MADYTLRIRRYSPETGNAPYWEEFGVDLDGHRSVLDGILQAKDRTDASIAIRCSCRAAICGSCGVRINGRPNLACHMHLDQAAENAVDGVIVVGALERKESRGAQFRLDYPKRDDENWLRHITLSVNGGDTPHIGFAPVTMTQWEPQERTY